MIESKTVWRCPEYELAIDDIASWTRENQAVIFEVTDGLTFDTPRREEMFFLNSQEPRTLLVQNGEKVKADPMKKLLARLDKLSAPVAFAVTYAGGQIPKAVKDDAEFVDLGIDRKNVAGWIRDYLGEYGITVENAHKACQRAEYLVGDEFDSLAAVVNSLIRQTNGDRTLTESEFLSRFKRRGAFAVTELSNAIISGDPDAAVDLASRLDSSDLYGLLTMMSNKLTAFACLDHDPKYDLSLLGINGGAQFYTRKDNPGMDARHKVRAFQIIADTDAQLKGERKIVDGDGIALVFASSLAQLFQEAKRR